LIEYLADANLGEFAAQVDLLNRRRFACAPRDGRLTRLQIHLSP
jgi:hypothetical protein